MDIQGLLATTLKKTCVLLRMSTHSTYLQLPSITCMEGTDTGWA